MILITGSSGKTGRALINALAKQKLKMRAMVRTHSQIDELKALGAHEGVVADLANPTEVASACADITQIYLICPNMHPNEIGLAQNIIAAAKAANVQRILYHSVLHPQTQKMPHHWNKSRVEEMLFESGVAYTILQPTAYMQNVLAGWSTILEENVYPVPYAVTTRLGMVDLADVAEAAAIVLASDQYTYGTYELCGLQTLDQMQVAQRIGQQIGRPVVAETLSHATWSYSARQAGLADLQIEWLIKMFNYYEQFGFEGSSATLANLLNRTPNSFELFLQEHIKSV